MLCMILSLEIVKAGFAMFLDAHVHISLSRHTSLTCTVSVMRLFSLPVCHARPMSWSEEPLFEVVHL